MEEITVQTIIECFDHPEELPTDEQLLLAEAKKAMSNAYAPYSRFHVGAALILENGKIQLGNNQENAAYPSGLCAERVAIFAAGAQYPGVSVLKIAISARSLDFLTDHPIAPCGACRQSMLEYELNQKKPITIIMMGETGQVYRVSGIQQLLPISFSEEGLKKM
jgi:cytidine deaminase